MFDEIYKYNAFFYIRHDLTRGHQQNIIEPIY